MKYPPHSYHRHRRGFTLLDAVLSLFVLAVMVAIYGSFSRLHFVNRRVVLRAEAAALADEELNALKQMDVTTLPTQTNGSFFGVLSNAGRWQLGTDSADLDGTSSPCPPPLTAKHCGPHILELARNGAIVGNASGRLLFPAGAYDVGTLRASWKIFSDSPAGSSVGFLFHAYDNANGYRLRVALTGVDLYPATAGTAENVLLEKLVGGAATPIWYRLTTITVSPDVWFNLRLVLNGGATNTMNIYLNGNQQDTNTINEATYASGQAALLGWAGVHAGVDDVQTISNGLPAAWNFDGSAELPAAWVRLSLNDLPDGTPNAFEDNGLLTLAPYPNVGGNTTLKQATITIRWTEGGATQSYSASGLIGNAGLGL